MKKAAVAEISFFDNVITQNIVDVKDDASWKDAYIEFLAQKNIGENKDYNSWVLDMPDDMGKAREELGNGEMDVCVTFID